jgi:carbonic anhydrase
MQRIDTIRQQLDDLLANIEIEGQALAAEQAAVARATEALHESPALQAALAQGQELMRSRVVALIDHQLAMLRESPTAALLRALRQQVREAEA